MLSVNQIQQRQLFISHYRSIFCLNINPGVGKVVKSKDFKSKKMPRSREKKHRCQYCEKKFFGKWNLETHIRLHSGERPFKCETCGKDFNQSDNLTNHQRIHNGEQPFKCNSCGKAFRQSSNLSKHIKTHNGEKPKTP